MRIIPRALRHPLAFYEPRALLGALLVGALSFTSPAAAQSAAAYRVYQGRNAGSDRVERFSRKVKIGRDGRVTITNVSGNITVTGGSGDEVSIDAVKHARDSGDMSSVQIVVDERPGRVEIHPEYPSRARASVDFTLTVPSSAAVEAKSVSGNIRITGVQGAVRAENVSGDITTASTPKLELAKTVSGDVDLTDARAESDLAIGSMSGNVHVKGLTARGLDLTSVSGDVTLTNASCDRMGMKSVSGSLEFTGTLSKSGRYDVNSHSGTIRLRLAGSTGFELNATTFSGSVRSELPLTLGGPGTTGDTGDRDRNGRRRPPGTHAIRATYGDGSATLDVRTFSGDIVISRQ
jgi:DUF4097 and DUF4098 domain-containing protein YvlB